MRLLQAPTHSPRRVSSDRCITHSRAIALSAEAGSEDTVTRHEPQVLAKHTVPADPYTAWLQQREAESERDERQPVRWICRQQRMGAPAIRASSGADRQARERRDSSGQPYPIRVTIA
jgi:hypothetical protein